MVPPPIVVRAESRWLRPGYIHCRSLSSSV